MTDIRELLREATDDIAVDDHDPVSRIRQATARRRRTRLAVMATVAAVVAAIVVPLSLNGSRSAQPAVTHNPRPPAHSIVQTWEPDDGEVASGFGAVWGMQCCGGSTKPSWVDKLDPLSGTRLARVRVPGPTATVATGAGRVWTIGATDGGPSAISVIDPATLHATTMKLRNVHAEPFDIAFADGSAWVTFELLDQVWRLTPTANGVQKSVLGVSGAPRFIATTGDGQLWVQRESGHGSLTRILVTPTSARLGNTQPWSGDIYSPGNGSSLWATTSDLHTVVTLLPSRIGGNACEVCNEPLLTVKGQVNDVVSTSRGLFVSSLGSPTSTGHTAFYSYRDLNGEQGAGRTPQPTARIARSGDLAPDGEGIVIGAGSAGLIHWVPSR